MKTTYLIQTKAPIKKAWSTLHKSRTLKAANRWLGDNSPQELLWDKKHSFRIVESNGVAEKVVYELSAKLLHKAINSMGIHLIPLKVDIDKLAKGVSELRSTLEKRYSR